MTNQIESVSEQSHRQDGKTGKSLVHGRDVRLADILVAVEGNRRTPAAITIVLMLMHNGILSTYEPLQVKSVVGLVQDGGRVGQHGHLGKRVAHRGIEVAWEKWDCSTTRIENKSKDQTYSVAGLGHLACLAKVLDGGVEAAKEVEEVPGFLADMVNQEAALNQIDLNGVIQSIGESIRQLLEQRTNES